MFGEAAVFLGFVLPGETAVIVGGFIASQGKVNVVALCAVVVRRGDRRRLGGLPRRHAVRHAAARRQDPARGVAPGSHRALVGLERRGATYVFLGRFTAFFRAVVPGLAGMSRMPYRRFLVANAAGGLCWGVGYTLLGYFAGHAYKRVEQLLHLRRDRRRRARHRDRDRPLGPGPATASVARRPAFEAAGHGDQGAGPTTTDLAPPST